MIWEWMNCVTENLNPDALMQCRSTIGELSIWVQALLVGMLVLLAGCCLIECLFGLRMKAFSRFLTGFSLAFVVCFLLLYQRVDLNETGLVLYPALAGVTGGLMYAYLEHAFRFVTGFAFGLALATWLLPMMNVDVSDHPGRIWRVAAAAVVGIACALLTNKGRFLLSAVTGAAALALLAETFIPYDRIPYLSEGLGLSEAMYRNLLAAVLAAAGILIQLIQLLVLRRKKKTEAAAEARRAEEAAERERSRDDGRENPEEENGPEEQEPAEDVSIADAEAILVEKARELAAAAARKSQMVRLQDRYADVAEGLYGPEVAARKLGMTQEAFLEGMRSSGFHLPEEAAQAESPAAETESEETSVQAEAEAEETGTPAAEAETGVAETAAGEMTGEGCEDGTVREESADLPETGQGDLGEDQGGAE